MVQLKLCIFVFTKMSTSMKTIFKYAIIFAANVILQFSLLSSWFDNLEIVLASTSIIVEIGKIVLVNIVALIFIYIWNFIAKKLKQTAERRFQVSIVILTLISFIIYIEYINYIIEKHDVRNEINNKRLIKTNSNYTINNLTFAEYQFIYQLKNIQTKLPPEALNISIKYEGDDLLPDYLFEISYFVPENIPIQTFDLQEDDFVKYQTFEIEKGFKKVVYSEILK